MPAVIRIYILKLLTLAYMHPLYYVVGFHHFMSTFSFYENHKSRVR